MNLHIALLAATDTDIILFEVTFQHHKTSSYMNSSLGVKFILPLLLEAIELLAPNFPVLLPHFLRILLILFDKFEL